MSEAVEIIARVVAADAAGRVLLTQRAGRDYWVPPGGHAHPGESLPQAARREFAEEAHLDVEVGPLLYVWELFWQGRHRVECGFLGTLAGAEAHPPVTAEDLGPAGGMRHRRCVSLDQLRTLPVFPAALATPGFQAMIDGFAREPSREGMKESYIGVDGPADPGFPHALSTFTILMQEERLLLVSDDTEQIWIPPGGAVEPGETLEAGAVREVAEETGLRVVLERMLYAREFVDEVRQRRSLQCYFLGRVVGGDLRMRADPAFWDVSTEWRVTRARWWEPAALGAITVYPEVLRDRLWRDLAEPAHDPFLGTARPR